MILCHAMRLAVITDVPGCTLLAVRRDCPGWMVLTVTGLDAV